MRPNPELLFDSRDRATEPLRNLLEMLGLLHAHDLRSAYAATQDAWYEKGKLRSEIKEKHAHLAASLMPLFDRLGLTMGLAAECAFFEWGVLFGGKIVAVRKRLNRLMEEWQRGHEFEKLVALGNNRSLAEDERIDPTVKNACCLTEAAMIDAVLEEARPFMPWSPSIVMPTVVIDKGGTEETLMAWKKRDNPEGSCLAASTQPYAMDQALAVQLHFRDMEVEVTAPEVTSTIPVTGYLDTIAKSIQKIVRLRG